MIDSATTTQQPFKSNTGNIGDRSLNKISTRLNEFNRTGSTHRQFQLSAPLQANKHH